MSDVTHFSSSVHVEKTFLCLLFNDEDFLVVIMQSHCSENIAVYLHDDCKSFIHMSRTATYQVGFFLINWASVIVTAFNFHMSNQIQN